MSANLRNAAIPPACLSDNGMQPGCLRSQGSRQNCFMRRELLITHAAQIVTLAGKPRPRVGAEMRELAIIEDGALLSREGVIVAVGAMCEADPPADARALRIDASGSVVMPGFVDAHTHPVFAGTREDEYEMRGM